MLSERLLAETRCLLSASKLLQHFHHLGPFAGRNGYVAAIGHQKITSIGLHEFLDVFGIDEVRLAHAVKTFSEGNAKRKTQPYSLCQKDINRLDAKREVYRDSARRYL